MAVYGVSFKGEDQLGGLSWSRLKNNWRKRRCPPRAKKMHKFESTDDADEEVVGAWERPEGCVAARVDETRFRFAFPPPRHAYRYSFSASSRLPRNLVSATLYPQSQADV